MLRACLGVVLWQRKWLILGSHEAIFELHSGAMGRKNGKVRFQKRSFAAQMTTSKHALIRGSSFLSQSKALKQAEKYRHYRE